MRRAVVLTAYDRPDLLEETLESLSGARGKDRWSLYISLDPSENPVIRKQVEEIASAYADLERAKWWDSGSPAILKQYARQGVLRHPYRVFEDLFAVGFDYVLRLEDDMLFTEDILEYHEWASEHFRGDKSIAFVESLADGAMSPESHDLDPAPDSVHVYPGFNSPLAIGTWWDSWVGVLRDSWDLDYSSGGDWDSGWDWNLSKRVYPRLGLRSVLPTQDKVWHTGIVGAHSTPEVYVEREPLAQVAARQDYYIAMSRQWPQEERA